ncbi:exosporium glycoprotein BclB-related protein [Taibaiella sp. KBW10]|uniref:exosporium glycoprotein BclB-related protein n=1 Tax=Taibaiella sp. KBW10 TaxID=2153357 RepID=UPI00268EE0CE|nr:exosporium glycoprotein BclB-related protein [Taibaiella sp. KBW10]
MKKIHALFALVLAFSLNVMAQTPQRINYQAVVRNSSGVPVTNQAVSLRFSVLDGSSSGTTQYMESQSTTTNAYGQANVQIGSGTPLAGTFSGITWSSASKFLKVDADITGGSTYTNLGTVELISVPYALNAQSSNDNRWTLSGADITSNNTGNIGIGGAPNAGAKLDISATNKGVLIPRITLANRPSSPVEGLLIYQTDNTPGFYYYTAGTWRRVANTADVANTGTIIPFASGLPVTMTTIVGGLVGTTGLVGFGNSASGVSLAGGTLDLTGAAGTLLNFAFVSPRAGTISSIAAQFSATTALSLIGSSVTVNAQLYTAPSGSNSFSAVPGASVNLAPALSGVISIGTTSSGLATGLSIPVVAGNRYILVFSATAAGITLVNTVVGYASGGLNIN